MSDTLQRLCKWRAIFAGWQLGTRVKEDPEAQAVRDQRELTLLLRAELSALTALLIEKGIIGQEQFAAQIDREAELLMASLERRFPGARAQLDGMHLSREAFVWMRNFPP